MRDERWSEHSEINRVLKTPVNGQWHSGGPVLYYHNCIPHYYDGEGHTLILGRSGVGKSYCGTKNLLGTLAAAKESFVVPDPKGELYKAIAPRLSKDYTVKLLDFRHITKSAGFNPLIYAYRLYKSGDAENIQMAREIIEEIALGFYPNKNRNDPFWDNSARTMFMSFVELLFLHAQSEAEINIYNLYQIVIKGDEKFATSNYLKELANLEPETSILRVNLQSYVNAPSETKGGMRCVYFEGLNPYVRSEAIIDMLSNDDFNIEGLDCSKPTAIFIILPDETPIYNTICGTVLSQLTRHYIKIAEDKYHGTLPIRMNIVIEELASVAHSISNLPHLMAASRSRNIRVTAVLQALSQLKNVYGESEADTILSNFGVTIAFSTNNFDTLQELSKRCGERMIRNGRVEPLITPVQLGAMGIGQALVIIENRYKYITQLPNFDELFGNTDTDTYLLSGTPVKRKPIKIFNLQEYVKQKKKESVFFPKKDTVSPPMSVDLHKDNKDDVINEDLTNIDKLLEKIDKKIAELEQEEELQKLEEQVNKKHTYKVEVTNFDGNKFKLANIILDNTDIDDFSECLMLVNNLPFVVEFSDMCDAMNFVRLLKDNGATARPKR